MTAPVALITAAPGASSRTRNRLREHPGPLTLKREGHPLCFGGAHAVCVEHPDGWLGWLPSAELRLHR